jgi:hypothetical protein
MTKLTLEEVKTERTRAQNTIDSLQRQKTLDLEMKRISIAEFNEISATQGRIQNKLNELNVLLMERTFDDILVGDDGPGALLGQSIARLDEAVGELDNNRKFLDSAASVINALNVIIGVLAALPIAI